MTRSVVGVVGAFFLVWTANAQTFWKDSFTLEFDYDPDSKGGPDYWDKVDFDDSEWDWYDNGHPLFDLGIPDRNECGERLHPAPVSLEQDSPCADTHEILTRQISSKDCGKDDLAFFITPYTLKAYMPLDDDDCERPTIDLPGDDKLEDYILVWMELHARSEHVIDGRRYDAELQMVHMGTDSVFMSTVSVLIDASARQDHVEFQWLLDRWQEVANSEAASCGGSTSPKSDRRASASYNNTTDATTNKDGALRRRTTAARRRQQGKEPTGSDYLRHRRAQTANVVNTGGRASPCKSDRFGNGCEPLGPRKKMYPYSLWPDIYYYAYRGSITTPPCADIVQWRVLDQPMTISRRQYKQLTNLLGKSKNDSCEDDSRISQKGENFRPLQDLVESEQKVTHCTYDDFSLFMYDKGDQ